MAYTYDGNDIHNVGSILPTNEKVWSVSFLFRVSDLTAGRILWSMNRTDSDNYFYNLICNTSGNLIFRARTTSNADATNTATTVSVDTWYGVTITCNGNNDRWIYVEQDSGVQNTTNKNVSGLDDMCLGGANKSTATYHQGDIMFFTMWDVVLTSTEASHMNRGRSPYFIHTGDILSHVVMAGSMADYRGNSWSAAAGAPTLDDTINRRIYIPGEIYVPFIGVPAGKSTDTDPGIFTLRAPDATVDLSYTASTDPGVFTLRAPVATVALSIATSVKPAVFTLKAPDADVDYAQSTDVKPAILTLKAPDATVQVAQARDAKPAVLTLKAPDAQVAYDQSTPVDPAVLTLKAPDATVDTSISTSVDPAVFTLRAPDATTVSDISTSVKPAILTLRAPDAGVTVAGGSQSTDVKPAVFTLKAPDTQVAFDQDTTVDPAVFTFKAPDASAAYPQSTDVDPAVLTLRAPDATVTQVTNVSTSVKPAVFTFRAPDATVTQANDISTSVKPAVLTFRAPDGSATLYLTADAPYMHFLFTEANWARDTFAIDATVRAPTGTARMRLYDVTDSTGVAGSTLKSTSTSYERVRGPTVSLADGHEYRVQLGADGGAEAEAFGARLVAI